MTLISVGLCNMRHRLMQIMYSGDQTRALKATAVGVTSTWDQASWDQDRI
jgi:hypothetical protein